MGIGLGRPGIEDQLRELGLPVVPRSERFARVRDTVAALRQLDGPDLHTPVVMAVRGPKGRALAAEMADTVTFVAMRDDPGVEIAQLARNFRAPRDVELALHVPVVDGALALGTWQGIYVIEHRIRPHRREIVLQFVGSRR
jgi:alkanesulfonate monooxygenase SsuD/methylene tetrahydromethanopterin reductase-like flavin-dependent oxidoreductase (luciferase family)